MTTTQNANAETTTRNAEYVSIWDGDEIVTSCKIDFSQSPPHVSDVEQAEDDGDLCVNEGEFIRLADGTEINTFYDADRDLNIVDGQPDEAE